MPSIISGYFNPVVEFLSALYADDQKLVSGIANDFQKVTLFYMQVTVCLEKVQKQLREAGTCSVSLRPILILCSQLHSVSLSGLYPLSFDAKISYAYLISPIFKRYMSPHHILLDIIPLQY